MVLKVLQPVQEQRLALHSVLQSAVPVLQAMALQQAEVFSEQAAVSF